ncbi:MAG: hypothetical protein EP343_27090 [Deltaproteobacteria bacterium]|nr:MAG: hypothetical protein EP343_27090 [Deltaproteobacteria bacterium]
MSTSINNQSRQFNPSVVQAPKVDQAAKSPSTSQPRTIGEPSANRYETNNRAGQQLIAKAPGTPARNSVQRTLVAPNVNGSQSTTTARPLSNAPLNQSQGVAQMSVDSTAEANRIAQDLNGGNINGDQAVRQAEAHAQQLRANGASPESVQDFYQNLATQTAGCPERVNSNGGQCYQNGNVRGATPGSVFETGVSDAFLRRANQAGIEGRMTNALGRPVDPNNLQDVRAYMDHVAGQEGSSGVQRELNDYMTQFYTHGHNVGYSNNWTNPPNVDDIQNSTLRDGGGRKVIDCDGYAAIAREVTDGIQGGRYQTQYGYVSGGDGAHMLLGIEDTQTGQGFVVDNNSTSATYNYTPGANASNAFRQGIQQSLNMFHNGQEITSNGTGVGSTIQGALNTMQ